MEDVRKFPEIAPKANVRLKEDLPGQIYTLDGFLSSEELARVMDWTNSVKMEGPKKPGKGEAERTARRGTIDSPEIADIILNALSPLLHTLDPPYRPSVPLLSPNIRVYHYPPGTFFRGHYDSPQMDPRSRRLSCWTVLVYLTSGVKGGGTTFWPDDSERDGGSSRGKKGKVSGKGEKGRPQDDKRALKPLTYEAKAGRLLLHWHGVARGGCMLHEGDEVIAGDKWVLRTDILA